jgi:hypothetical protein
MTPSFKTSRIGLRAKYGKKLAKKHAIATSGKGDDLLLSQSQDYLTASAILDIVGKGGAPEKKVSPVGFSSLLKQFCGKSLNDAVEKKVPELGIDSVGKRRRNRLRKKRLIFFPQRSRFVAQRNHGKAR